MLQRNLDAVPRGFEAPVVKVPQKIPERCVDIFAVEHPSASDPQPQVLPLAPLAVLTLVSPRVRPRLRLRKARLDHVLRHLSIAFARRRILWPRNLRLLGRFGLRLLLVCCPR